MTGAVLATAGTLLLLATIADTITTVLRIETHSGPITHVVSQTLWRLLAGPWARREGGPPAVTGVAITLVVVAVWLLLTFAGWYLIFSASAQAVLHGDSGDPADSWARAYFVAYVISTLGIGDYVPGGALWQVLTGLAATAGFAMATLVITYMVSITAAVSSKRRFARTISQLGGSPEQIVRRAWDGEGFDSLEDHLIPLVAQLNEMAEQHLTYPIIYYYRTKERHVAHWPAVATLDDALLIVDELVDERVRPPTLAVTPARAAVTAYVVTLPEFKLGGPVPEPPPPALHELRDVGIPLRAGAAIDAAVRANADRRRRLAAVLDHQGWTWKEAVQPQTGAVPS